MNSFRDQVYSLQLSCEKLETYIEEIKEIKGSTISQQKEFLMNIMLIEKEIENHNRETEVLRKHYDEAKLLIENPLIENTKIEVIIIDTIFKAKQLSRTIRSYLKEIEVLCENKTTFKNESTFKFQKFISKIKEQEKIIKAYKELTKKQEEVLQKLRKNCEYKTIKRVSKYKISYFKGQANQELKHFQANEPIISQINRQTNKNQQNLTVKLLAENIDLRIQDLYKRSPPPSPQPLPGDFWSVDFQLPSSFDNSKEDSEICNYADHYESSFHRELMEDNERFFRERDEEEANFYRLLDLHEPADAPGNRDDRDISNERCKTHLSSQKHEETEDERLARVEEEEERFYMELHGFYREPDIDDESFYREPDNYVDFQPVNEPKSQYSRDLTSEAFNTKDGFESDIHLYLSTDPGG